MKLMEQAKSGAAWLLAALTAVAIGCGPTGGPAGSGGGSSQGGNLQGKISIDGSSTVFPISAAVAEEFSKLHSSVKVTVGQSGSGAGFKKFLEGDIDIADASRPINEKEIATAKEKGIEFVEFTVAIDGLSVVVNPQATWVDNLTVEQLRDLWKPEPTATKWSDLNPEWPAETIKLFGPGTASGTFEYFTEAIVGEKNKSRTDYSPSENDNVLVTGVAEEKNSLGYFGLAYYESNSDRLKVVGIDSGKGPVKPTHDSIMSGDYTPLARPLFIYVNTRILQRPEGVAFVQFYLENAQKLATEAKYIAITDETVSQNKARLDSTLSAK